MSLLARAPRLIGQVAILAACLTLLAATPLPAASPAAGKRPEAVDHIVNGSFEQFSGGTADLGGPAWNSPVVPGWSVLRGGVDIIHRTYSANNYDWTSSDGDWHIELASDSANASIAQTIPGLEVGQPYKLTFDHAGHRGMGTQIVEVVWNGAIVARIDSTDHVEWRTASVTVTAGPDLNRLEFHEIGRDGDWAATRLDNVRLISALLELSQRRPPGSEPPPG